MTEGRRLAIQERRQQILDGATPCAEELERLVRLTTIDELWCEYLSALAEIRSGVQWVSLAGTYITTDQPFGTWVQSALREYVKRRTAAGNGETNDN